MPVLGTIGAASARNYGLFGYVKKVPTGSMGVFARTSAGNPIHSYQWANDVVAPYTPLVVALGSGTTGVSNSVIGIIVAGTGSQLTFTNRILWSNNTIAQGTRLTAWTSNRSSGGCGNATKGILFFGNNTLNTQQYIYAGDLTGAGGSLTRTSSNGAAAGNATFGIVAIAGSSATIFSNSYTYANDVAAVATSFTVSQIQGGGMGNADVGIFAKAGQLPTQIYNYAANTTTVGASLIGPPNLTFQAGAGNEVYGIMIGSGGTNPNKYTYSSNTVVSGTVMGTGTAQPVAVANGLVGVTT